ncbi:MAG: DUF2764 family protein [Candidatus Marinimicrobia bacterium]|nr:DUF2764 family protein [Candidatus Neomarinimicrobiota bacterium]
MDKYYYFVAQLPYLHFDKETYMNIELFFNEGLKWLSNKDYNVLKSININEYQIKPYDPEIVKKYKQFEYELRLDMANYRRAKKMSQEYKTKYVPSGILRESTPLEIEKALMKARWDFIDELEIDHHFDLEKLITYLLKLQILERLFTFNKEKGFEKFKQTCEVNYE